jgi:hypothetical protein
VGDFDVDGDPDLAVTNVFFGTYSPHNISILLGGAGGGFSEPTGFTAGAQPSSVAVSDFNGDNDQDLAVTNLGSNDVSILLGSAADDGYPRPKGASPLRVSLVPAYPACTAPDRTHGPPLAFGSCSQPQQLSPELTVGTFDANGAAANAVGFARLTAIVGDLTTTTTDEADMRITVSVTDVRRSDLTDYPGELLLLLGFRLTDKHGQTGRESQTTQDLEVVAPVPCTPTGSGSIGSTCFVDTTLDAIVPGAVLEGKRAIWRTSALRVDDAGADGDAATRADNAAFLKQGIFVP